VKLHIQAIIAFCEKVTAQYAYTGTGNNIMGIMFTRFHPAVNACNVENVTIQAGKVKQLLASMGE
jgi:hypothetical protein